MSYIDREAAIRAIENDCLEAVYYTKRDAIDSILAQPLSDVVEVVRCKDCRHFGPEVRDKMHPCKLYIMSRCFEDDYCNYGERSKNGKS